MSVGEKVVAGGVAAICAALWLYAEVQAWRARRRGGGNVRWRS
jgi:hypothetical protein